MKCNQKNNDKIRLDWLGRGHNAHLIYPQVHPCGKNTYMVRIRPHEALFIEHTFTSLRRAIDAAMQLKARTK